MQLPCSESHKEWAGLKKQSNIQNIPFSQLLSPSNEEMNIIQTLNKSFSSCMPNNRSSKGIYYDICC